MQEKLKDFPELQKIANAFVSNISELKQQQIARDNLTNLSDKLEHIRVSYLGKTGIITSQLKTIGNLSIEQKKTFGSTLNLLKNYATDEINTLKNHINEATLDIKLASEKIDITIPSQLTKRGKIHPITAVIEEITEIFGAMGFTISSGPEIENDFNNFTALNIAKNHPARQMHDTFYINSDSMNTNADGQSYVLRTHMSPVQIRVMSSLGEGNIPIKTIASGRTYRCDSDQTHSPMFHQMEGLYVDEKVSFGDLKECLEIFLSEFFQIKNLKIRFRPSYFPFTEPSAEVDIICNKKTDILKIGDGDDWLEVLGCGMVHPNVLRNCGIDSEKYTAFAFGLGIERLAMLKYGMRDLREFFGNNISWLNNYGFSDI